MSVLAAAVAHSSSAPTPAGLGSPASAFKATVLATSPLRVQAQGVDLPATAVVGLTLTAGQTVLVVSTGSVHYAIARLT